MGYKQDTNQIKQYVQYLKNQYGFQGLLHFTDFSNLRSIFHKGYLCSRAQCEEEKIVFQDGANHNVINRASGDVKKCVRFYYREKTPTLYDNEGIKLKEYCDEVHIPIPVYLLFDEELLYLDNTYFSNGNATNSNIGNTAEFFRNMDWSTIFHFGWFELQERDYIVNKRHAELLSSDPISLQYLKKIIFRCETDRKRAINLFGNDIRYEVNINMFSDKNNNSNCKELVRNNFIKDYNISLQNDTIELQLQFNKPWEDLDIRGLIYDINGNEINANSVEVEYQPIFGPRVKNSVNNNEKIIFKLKGNIKDWHKISIFINGFECVEEYLRKYEIVNYNIRFNNEDSITKMVLYRQFRDFQFSIYQHRYEIFDEQGNLIINGILNFPNNITGLGWDCTFNNFNQNWNRIRYYINEVLCIDEFIENPNKYITYIDDGDIPF